MSTIDEISNLFIWLIRIGAGLRIAFCFFRKMGNEEAAGVYNKRMKNTLVFHILSESIFQIKEMAMYYFGG